MSKFIKTLVVIIGVILIALVVFFGVMLIKHNFNIKDMFSNIESTELIAEKELNFSKKISLETNSGTIEVRESDDDKMKVELYSSHAKSYSINEEDTISINIKESKLGFFKRLFNHEIAKIVLYLPVDYDGDINIKNSVGSVKVYNFVDARVNIDSDVADVKIKEVKDLDVKVNVGDVRVDLINNSLNANINIGDLNIKELLIKEDSSIKLDVGSVYIKNTNDIYINSKVNTGNINVKNNNRYSDLTLKVKVNVGDINIDNDDIIDESKLLSELDEFKIIDLDHVTSVKVVKVTIAGPESEEYKEKPSIESYYNKIGNIKIGQETKMSCEDNSTLYVFVMDDDSRVTFTIECDWLIVGNKRYMIVK